MAILGKPVRPGFGCTIEGNLGRFKTPAGDVYFLQTIARLSRGDTSNAGRLTSLLTPAREALDVREMDFNQLLQRDLDDHRIAHELVPYILRSPLKAQGPAFFPPIVAAILPFQDRRPMSEIPAFEIETNATDPDYGPSSWRFTTSGEVFRLQQYCDASGNPDPSGTAVLRWNDERAKLVIIDGQHRAMALLAIHRTVTNSWGAGAAASERYKPFYEARVRELLMESDDPVGPKELEFPVTICIFKDYAGPGLNPHNAARKLFVDVNKEAKPPSESRLILLSDIRLDYVLARELLNHLRSTEQDGFPLYAVEYDNPEPKSTTPRRWNAVTNLEILLRSVDFCCFGPKEVVDNVATLASVKGKPNKRVKSSYFRDQMRLQDVVETPIQDGPRKLDRLEIGLDQFPVYNQVARQAILDRFFETWGKGLLRLFSEVEPYRAHIAAVRFIADGWGPDMTAALAREALFEGVGMFWTLEQGDAYWKEQVTAARAQRTPLPARTDVSRAWQIVEVDKRQEFEKVRARLYLNKEKDDDVTSSREFYDVAITYAAQVGLALTWAMLRAANSQADPSKILDALISGINRSLTTGPVASRTRRLIFRKSDEDDFNLLPKMDAPFASYFRFFWLELMMIEANRDELKEAGIDVDGALGMLARGRRFYLLKIADDYAESILVTSDPPISKIDAAKKGQETAINVLARGYHKWFGWKTEEAREMLTALSTTEVSQKAEAAEAADATLPEADNGEPESES